MKYRISYDVWVTGQGYQPHDLADDEADTIDDARVIAQRVIDGGAQLGTVSAAITDTTTDEVIEDI